MPPVLKPQIEKEVERTLSTIERELKKKPAELDINALYAHMTRLSGIQDDTRKWSRLSRGTQERWQRVYNELERIINIMAREPRQESAVGGQIPVPIPIVHPPEQHVVELEVETPRVDIEPQPVPGEMAGVVSEEDFRSYQEVMAEDLRGVEGIDYAREWDQRFGRLTEDQQLQLFFGNPFRDNPEMRGHALEVLRLQREEGTRAASAYARAHGLWTEGDNYDELVGNIYRRITKKVEIPTVFVRASIPVSVMIFRSEEEYRKKFKIHELSVTVAPEVFAIFGDIKHYRRNPDTQTWERTREKGEKERFSSVKFGGVRIGTEAVVDAFRQTLTLELAGYYTPDGSIRFDSAGLKVGHEKNPIVDGIQVESLYYRFERPIVLKKDELVALEKHTVGVNIVLLSSLGTYAEPSVSHAAVLIPELELSSDLKPGGSVSLAYKRGPVTAYIGPHYSSVVDRIGLRTGVNYGPLGIGIGKYEPVRERVTDPNNPSSDSSSAWQVSLSLNLDTEEIRKRVRKWIEGR